MKSITILCIILLLFAANGLGASLDDLISEKCGTHPVIRYLTDLKGAVLDPQMLTEAEKCASIEGEGKVIKLDFANAKIAGCLTEKYGYNEEFIKELAPLVKDAKENTAGQISTYEECVNNIRRGGEGINKDNLNTEREITNSKSLVNIAINSPKIIERNTIFRTNLGESVFLTKDNKLLFSTRRSYHQNNYPVIGIVDGKSRGMALGVPWNIEDLECKISLYEADLENRQYDFYFQCENR